jgi:DNA repair protein RecO (recombination protein O)
MNESLNVIMLSQGEYKDNDALIRTLSLEKGILTFIAKGLLKVESKNASACLPFSESTLIYDEKEGSTLQLLHSASLSVSHRALREDLNKQTVMTVLSELTEQLLKESYDLNLIKDVYRVYTLCMAAVETGDNYKHALSFFLVSALVWLGIEPQVDECALCGERQVNSLSMDEGGFICVNCQKEIQSPLYSTEFLYTFRIVNKVTPDNFSRFLSYTAPDKSIIETLYDFMKYHSNISLKSWVFLEKWSIIN